MSFVKLQPENFDTFSLTLRPRTEFSSSSLGVTGSVRLVERPSSLVKQLSVRGLAGTTAYTESGTALTDYLSALNSINTDESYRETSMTIFLDKVNALPAAQKNSIVIPVTRITQSVEYDRGSHTKSLIKNTLMPDYRNVFTDCNYAYKNYHTINFFTASSVPSDSAILYGGGSRYTTLTGAISLDFYINPRYMAPAGTDFKAGAIFHVSSSVCVSLHTGSHKNENNQTDKFRIAVSFNRSASTRPDLIDLTVPNGSRSAPHNVTYVSDDNSLSFNHWHHVSIRWGTTTNNKTGSIQIDALTSSFSFPSSSISVDRTPSNVFVLGNFYSGSKNPNLFFNPTVASKEGLRSLGSAGTADPTGFEFTNPLNAEIHDFKVFNRFISNSDVSRFRSSGPEVNEPNLIFYVPPYFTNIGTATQDIMLTPTDKRNSSGILEIRTPFNPYLAAGTQVFLPNAQNFLCDMVNNYRPPRLYQLTASVDTDASDLYAVDHMFRSPQYTKLIYTIMPNDNGLFTPNYDFIVSGSARTFYSPYLDDRGSFDSTLISLNQIDTSLPRTSIGTGSIRTSTPSPTNYSTSWTSIGNITTLNSFNTTGSFADTSSNLSTIYQSSNLSYGNQIFPESFTLASTRLTGSRGTVNIALKDNGAGGIYRADAVTPHARWANVGNIFYDQGLAILTSPHLYYFGKENFEASYNGSQNIHTYTIDAICPAGEINSSSNLNYTSYAPTNDQNETADNFVYITGINIHDDNFNVIMKANLAQPVLKRPDEEFLFRLRYDM